MKKAQLRQLIRGIIKEQSQVYYYPELTICHAGTGPPWFTWDDSNIGQIWGVNQSYASYLDGNPLQPGDVGKIIDLWPIAHPGLLNLEITN